ncbi:uncharacterized protein LOC134183196 [Corticium candelabrum]|uniref:uncharacterized protein LOC134183196 n=1 Tax=Corticium candelabrum TaxID=121492 RepID=UPI002E2632D2|nr:uncharacterized protein LOC134183196 [Corticium candelabrum]
MSCLRSSLQINGDGVVSRTKIAGVELTVPIAVYGILHFTIGFVLIADWCAGNPGNEFREGEWYLTLLMASCLVWMLWVMVKTKLTIRHFQAAGSSPRPFERGALSHRATGSSLLVKTLTAFAAFSLLLAIFQTADSALATGSCFSKPAVVSCVCRILYILTQVCYVVYSQKRVLFEKKFVHGAAVIQMIITNFILYGWTFLKSKDRVFTHEERLDCTTIDALKKLNFTALVNLNFASYDGSVLNEYLASSDARPIPNNNMEITLLNSECYHTVFKDTFPWLYPFCLEFCLTASAMIAEQWMEWPSPPTSPMCDDDDPAGRSLIEEHRHVSCNRGERKLSNDWATSVGMLAFVARIGVIAYLIIETNSDVAATVFYGIRMLSAILITLLSAYGLYTLGRCKRGNVSAGLDLDEVLLLIATIGAFALALFRCFAGLASLIGPAKIGLAKLTKLAKSNDVAKLTKLAKSIELAKLIERANSADVAKLTKLIEGAKLTDEEHTYYELIVFFAEVLVVVGILAQTVFISKALHREPGEHGLITTTSMAMFMGWLNFGLWLGKTVHLEGTDYSIYHCGTMMVIDSLQLIRYGKQSWLIFILLCFPFAIFYRIHSAVVLYRVSKIHRYVKEVKEVKSPAIDDIERQRDISNRLANLKREHDKVTSEWNEFCQNRRPLVQQQLRQLEELNQTMRNDTP